MVLSVIYYIFNENLLLNKQLQKYNVDISDVFIEVNNHIQLIFKSLWKIEKNKINFID